MRPSRTQVCGLATLRPLRFLPASTDPKTVTVEVDGRPHAATRGG
jgi:hypothetical protein